MTHNTQGLGNIYDINWPETLTETRTRMDFQGVQFRANFGPYPPFCILNKVGSKTIPSGIFPEIINLFGSLANLTVVFVEPKPENVGIWSSR